MSNCQYSIFNVYYYMKFMIYIAFLSTLATRGPHKRKQKDKSLLNNILSHSAQHRMYILPTAFHLIGCSHFITVRVHHYTDEYKERLPCGSHLVSHNCDRHKIPRLRIIHEESIQTISTFATNEPRILFTIMYFMTGIEPYLSLP